MNRMLPNQPPLKLAEKNHKITNPNILFHNANELDRLEWRNLYARKKVLAEFSRRPIISNSLLLKEVLVFRPGRRTAIGADNKHVFRMCGRMQCSFTKLRDNLIGQRWHTFKKTGRQSKVTELGDDLTPGEDSVSVGSEQLLNLVFKLRRQGRYAPLCGIAFNRSSTHPLAISQYSNLGPHFSTNRSHRYDPISPPLSPLPFSSAPQTTRSAAPSSAREFPHQSPGHRFW